MAVLTWAYEATSRSRAAVMTASVPSEPVSTDGQCRPTVSLGRPASEPTTVPSASTASTPRTWCRIVPNRTTREPPALVAIAPPTVADSRAAKSIGVSRPTRRAACCQSAIVTPAPAVSAIAGASTSQTRSKRRIDSTTTSRPSRRAPPGTPPPTSPVLPACGITATSSELQYRSTAASSAVEPGRTTAAHAPPYLPVQSRS
jgi:hypothetical protein